MTTPFLCRKCISLTLVVEVLQVTADVDADVLHFHVLQTGKLVHVLQQPVILASSWTCKDMGRICMREKKTERYRSKYENECISKSLLWLGIYRFYCAQVIEEKIKLCAICCKKKNLLVLLAGRRPSFQTYQCTAHPYLGLQAPQPPLLSPHLHHLNTNIRSWINTTHTPQLVSPVQRLIISNNRKNDKAQKKIKTNSSFRREETDKEGARCNAR